MYYDFRIFAPIYFALLSVFEISEQEETSLLSSPLILGPMELQAISHQHDINRTIVTVDLDSVYKTHQGEHVYWLEKAEVERRNKWELIILLHFVDGLAGSIKSKTFRITTKSSHKLRKENRHPAGN